LQHAPELERLLMAQERFAGQTALHLAAAAGHAALCKVLLEMAPSPAMLLAAKDKSGGFTPLQLACEKGQAEVVEALLEADPERAIRLKDCLDKWSGFSALHLIAYRGHEEAAKALLRGAPDKRAILALKDQRGRTAADLAADRGRRPVASLLADAPLGAVTELSRGPGNSGSTPESQPASMSQFMELNVLEALGRLAEGIYRLRGYAELNHAAAFKILRKHDKILKREDGIALKYPSNIENTIFADMGAFEALDASVRQAFQNRSASAEPGISPEELSKCDAQWIEQLLEERAAEILFNGVERTEPASEDGLIYLYFPALEIGPYSTQVRMTVRISLQPQRAEVQVLEINPGLRDKRTGSVEYQKDLDKLLEANAEIVLRWQDDPRSDDLRIVQQALQRFKYYLPGWFPVPDSVTEAVLRTFITRAIKAGQDEVFRALQKEAAVALLAAGLGKRSATTAGLQGPALRAERLLFFFIGLSLALVLAIIVLMALPAKDPATFSRDYFLCSFPVFRVCLSLVLVIVGMATVARVCEDNFVNHFFILTIDPRCRISPNFLFSWAMLLSSAWILIFGMYVVDYKWMVLPLSCAIVSRKQCEFPMAPRRRRWCCCCCCCHSSATQEAAESSEASSEDDDFWQEYEQREFDSFAFPPAKLCPALCSSTRASSSGDEEDGLPRRRYSAQKHCWDQADGAGIKVRGPDYLRDKRKCQTESPMLALSFVDIFRGRDLECFSSSQRSQPRDKSTFLLVLNFRLPDSQLVACWSVPQDAEWSDSRQGRLLQRFLQEMSAPERDKRLKLIARVLEGSYMLKQAVGSKPAIIANQCRITYFAQKDFLEASVDMGDSSMGRRIRGLFDDGSSALELFVLLEGLQPEELPERLLGGLTLCHIDMRNVWSSSTRLERASWHYVLYPVVLAGISFILLVQPSSICRFRYKAQLIRGVGRTCLAPLYAVSFCDNMIGDVLTSLAKPLRDVPPAICYLSSHHPQLQSSMERFIRNGSTCPSWEASYVQPLIGGAPFWFRLLQCARRYYDTGQRRHLLNLGKYAASLLVVVLSRPGYPKWIVILASAVATCYAAIWDVTMDWGLGVEEIFLGRLNGHGDGGIILSPRGRHDSYMGESPQSWQGSAVELNLMRQTQNSQPSRHFPRRVYYIAIMMDILLRLTWVLTLMPVTILTTDIVAREILHCFMTVAEIFRRTFWAILRIEYEQVANASGYRALLWVPMKVGQRAGETEVRTARGWRTGIAQRLLN
ncbi:xpr1, partial [Symbiodinium necroappetens]